MSGLEDGDSDEYEGRIKTTCRANTKYNADCIDFCPIKGFQHILAVGTYELVNKLEMSEANDENVNLNENSDESTSQRIGCLYLYLNTLEILQEMEMPGILDVRWCPNKIYGQILLGVVDSKGLVTVYSLVKLDENEEKYFLEELCSVKVTPDLALYLDWSNYLKPSETPTIAISDSKGYINLFNFDKFAFTSILRVQAHKFEAWVTSFNYWNPNTVYTGGDDCKLKGYDIRGDAEIFSSNEHTGGVTSIQPSFWKENLLFSGCYDGNLIAWDSRKMKSPISKTNLGGGVWRLRSEPFNKPWLLASTMHNGFKILKVHKNDLPEVVETYTEHESLAYGACWAKLEDEHKHIIGSVSFYDKLLTVWEMCE